MRMLIIFMIIMFSICCFADQKEKVWICFANQVKDTTCGTYAWSKNKQTSIKEAIKLCQKTCNDDCYIEYCDQGII
jgi:hypothetical protein